MPMCSCPGLWKGGAVMAHDSFPPLTGVNIPAYPESECVLIENLKLDSEQVNTFLIEKQEAGATIISVLPHFSPKFDSWEVLIVYRELWADDPQ
jgi:hypothetical protein